MVKRAAARLRLLLFPHKCFLCGRVLEDDGWLCAECEPLLPRTGDALCTGCGKLRRECICGAPEEGYDRAAAPLFYEGRVRFGVWRYKYSGRQYYAPFLARMMAERFAQMPGLKQPELLTYVPLHPKKQRQRGFCQTELLAMELGALLNVPVRGGLLAHSGSLQAQMEMKGLAQRERNAEGSFFACEGARLSGERVLLVDDLLTTGATARRCARLLKGMGAGEVWVLTAATTRRKVEKTEKG